jgi:hypothetical protein
MIGIKYKYVDFQRSVINELAESERKEMIPEASLKISTSNHNFLSRASYNSGEDNLAVSKKLRQSSVQANQPKPLFL